MSVDEVLWAALPEHAWLVVARELGEVAQWRRVACVCRAWRRVATQPALVIALIGDLSAAHFAPLRSTVRLFVARIDCAWSDDRALEAVCQVQRWPAHAIATLPRIFEPLADMPTSMGAVRTTEPLRRHQPMPRVDVLEATKRASLAPAAPRRLATPFTYSSAAEASVWALHNVALVGRYVSLAYTRAGLHREECLHLLCQRLVDSRGCLLGVRFAFQLLLTWQSAMHGVACVISGRWSSTRDAQVRHSSDDHGAPDGARTAVATLVVQEAITVDSEGDVRVQACGDDSVELALERVRRTSRRRHASNDMQFWAERDSFDHIVQMGGVSLCGMTFVTPLLLERCAECTPSGWPRRYPLRPLQPG